MSVHEKLAYNLTYEFIGKYAGEDRTKEDLERIEYGLACFFIQIPKVLLLFLVGAIFNNWISNFFWYLTMTFFSFGLLRSHAWGLHLKKDWQCSIGSFINFYGIIFISMLIKFTILHIIIIFVLTFLHLYQNAPADTKEKPIYSEKLKSKLRNRTLASMLLLFAASMIFLNILPVVSNIFIISVFTECLLVSPFTYKMLKLN